MPDFRIASLISSATEILCGLGLENNIVARSHECDFPSSILGVTQVTSPKFPTDGTSYQIDQRVRAILQEGLSVYRVDADVLRDLKPSHIVTQTQCHVCAVSLKDVECSLDSWLSAETQIINLDGSDLEGVFLDIRKIARALNVDLRGENLIRSLKHRLQKIWAKTEVLPINKSAFLVEWIDPLLSAGHWMPELSQIAGIDLIYSQKGGSTPPLSWNQILESDPDFILFAPCGWGIESSLKEWSTWVKPKEWNQLKAVKENQVFVADGNQFFNRPGPRLVETAEILAEIAHPDLFSFGHNKSSWRRLG